MSLKTKECRSKSNFLKFKPESKNEFWKQSTLLVVNAHWYLDGNTFSKVINQAWLGLKSAIDFDGSIKNIIGETGIKDTSEDYEPETTKYCDSAPGLGAVLRAVAAVIKSTIKKVPDMYNETKLTIWLIDRCNQIKLGH